MDKIKKYLKENKLFIILYSILTIICLLVIIFTYNNHSFYKDPIAKIISTKENYISTNHLDFGYREDIYDQEIKAKVLNGKYKGKIITIENEYYEGEAYSQNIIKMMKYLLL